MTTRRKLANPLKGGEGGGEDEDDPPSQVVTISPDWFDYVNIEVAQAFRVDAELNQSSSRLLWLFIVHL